MVGAHEFIVNSYIYDVVSHVVRNYKIIYSPSDIFIACIEPLIPPGIDFFIGILFPIDIDESRTEQLGEPVPFDLQESGGLSVGFRIFQVDLVMSHIEVSGNDDFSSGFLQRDELAEEILIESHLVAKPFFALTAVGEIYAEDGVFTDVDLDDSAFHVLHLDT